MPLYLDIEKKHHDLSSIIGSEIKTVSKSKDNSMKVVCPLLLQLSSFQTLTSSKYHVSIFPSFISGLPKIGFLKKVYQIFGKTRTSRFSQITI